MTKRQGCRTLILGHILGSMMLYLADAYGTDRLQAVAEEAEKQTNPETSRESVPALSSQVKRDGQLSFLHQLCRRMLEPVFGRSTRFINGLWI
jgi:hypothetical protein